MVDLRRFPVSDEFFPDMQTFCVILDRNKIFEIPNYVFFIIGHVTPADMKMSEITLRIECKHSRIPARPASCRNRPLNSRNLGFGHEDTFFQSYEKFEKWEVPNEMLSGESKLFLGEWNWSEVIRAPGGWASLCKGSNPPRKVQMCIIVKPLYPIFDLASSVP